VVELADAASIKVVKTLEYRGFIREWTNRYYFDGGAPADNTKWTTFSDAVTAAEKATMYNAGLVVIKRTHGYEAGSDIPVFEKTYTLNGTGGFANPRMQAGDVAIVVRWATPDRSSKNHPIYCFNYFHGVLGNSVGTADEVNPAQKTAFQTYAAAWISGFSDGAVTHKRSRPNETACTGYQVDPMLRHRDFPPA
jgi:hypothetical protein